MDGKMNGIPKEIVKYLSGTCSDEEYGRVTRWLNTSERNKEWLLDLKALWDKERIRDCENGQYLDSQFQQTWEKIDSAKHKARKRRLHLSGIAGAVAAACLVGFMLGFGVLKRLQNTAPGFPMETLSSGDCIRRVILPDQSVVWLNEDSEIRFAPKFGQRERRVLLTGEAFFDVVPDKDKPFRVETSDFTVKVSGTTFNVSSGKGSGASDATLLSGRIVIEDGRMHEILALRPGQKVYCQKDDKGMVVENIDVESEVAWKNQYLGFDHSNLKQVFEKVEYVYGVKILFQFASDACLKKTYSGAVAMHDSVEAVLKSLQNVMPFHFWKTPDGYVVSTDTE